MTEPNLAQMFQLPKRTRGTTDSTEDSAPQPPTPTQRNSEDAQANVAPPNSQKEATSRTPRKKATSKRAASRSASTGPAKQADDEALVDVPASTRRTAATRAPGRASIMMYVPESVADTFKAFARTQQLSYGQVALLCVEATIDELPTIFAERAGATSKLFSTNYKPRSTTGEKKAALNLHIVQQDLETIEDLWRNLDGCRSRNDLLSTAATEHLAKDTRV